MMGRKTCHLTSLIGLGVILQCGRVSYLRFAVSVIIGSDIVVLLWKLFCAALLNYPHIPSMHNKNGPVALPEINLKQ